MTEEPFDPRAALGLLEDAERRTRRSLDPRLPLQLLTWGIAWLVGFGAVFLDVRAQQPYTGPSVVSGVVLAVVFSIALVVTVLTVARATAGIGGPVAARGRAVGRTWGMTFVAGLAICAAIARTASDPRIGGLLFAAVPVLLTGVLYLTTAAALGGRIEAALGSWLVLMAVLTAFLTPVGAPLLAGLGGGIGFVVAAGRAAGRAAGSAGTRPGRELR